jgi:DNA-binding SARP family transcriptional activator
MLSLAFLAEWSAHYETAVDWLERLVEARPEHREGRLRLAVNRARLGDRGRAEAALSQLAQGGETDWIAGVAVSELARLLAEDGRLEEAVAALEAFRERSAAGRCCAVQLAQLLDRLGRRQQAEAALRELAPPAAPLAPAPRFLYRTPPGGARQAPRGSLEEAAAAGLAPLGEALSELRQSGP